MAGRVYWNRTVSAVSQKIQPGLTIGTLDTTDVLDGGVCCVRSCYGQIVTAVQMVIQYQSRCIPSDRFESRFIANLQRRIDLFTSGGAHLTTSWVAHLTTSWVSQSTTLRVEVMRTFRQQEMLPFGVLRTSETYFVHFASFHATFSRFHAVSDSIICGLGSTLS